MIFFIHLFFAELGSSPGRCFSYGQQGYFSCCADFFPLQAFLPQYTGSSTGFSSRGAPQFICMSRSCGAQFEGFPVFVAEFIVSRCCRWSISIRRKISEYDGNPPSGHCPCPKSHGEVCQKPARPHQMTYTIHIQEPFSSTGWDLPRLGSNSMFPTLYFATGATRKPPPDFHIR